MRYVPKKDISINRYKILQYIIVIFFLNRIVSMDILGNIAVLDEIYVLISEIITIWCTLKWIWYYFQKQKMYLRDVNCIIVVIFYFLLLIMISIINDGNVRRIFMTAYPIIGSLCFLDIESKKYNEELLTALYYFFYLMITCNFVDMLIVRKTFSYSATEFLVGGRNQMAIILSITTSCALAYYEEYKKNMKNVSKIFNIILHIIILLSAILAGSATTFIVIITIYALYLLMFIKMKNIILRPYFILFGYSLIWLALIVFRLQYMASDLIVNVLHKDLTLSHRTIIWDEALRLIGQRPIFGHGMTDSVNIFTVEHDYTGGHNNVYTTLSSHNEILQILYYGGFALLLAFILLYIVCCSYRKRLNDKFSLFFFSVIAILIVWLSEVPSEYAMFFVLGLCYYSNRFDGGKKV